MKRRKISADTAFMIFIAALLLMLATHTLVQSQGPWSGLSELSETPASNDMFSLMDVSDLTMAATGTNKRITYSNVMSGNAATATELAANGANCGAGNYPLGVDASGAVESCTADDDDPEAGDVTWTDLTDEGTFTDTKYCTYSSGTGFISCDTSGAAIGTDDVGTDELDDGSDTPSVDDVVAVDPADTSQFAYFGVPDCDDGSGHLNYDTTSHAFSCGTADDDVPEAADYTNLTGGDGIDHSTTGTVKVDPVTAGSDGDSSTAESDSGLEFVGNKLTLLRGCGDNEILKWDETDDDWNCETDTGGASTFDQIGSGTNTSATMTVDTGASMTFANSGTINASSMEGTDFGTMTDANLCTYDSAGTEVDCNTATSTFVADGCSDCLNATEIEDIYLLNTGDEINTADLVVNGVEVDFHNGASAGYPLLSGQSTCDSDACDAAAEYGRLCFDTDADTDGSVMVCTSVGWKEVDDDGAAGGSPGGGSGDVQYNDGASGFAGESDFDYNTSTNTLNVDNVTVDTAITVAKQSGVAGSYLLYEANSTDTNGTGWMGPASVSTDLYFQFSNTAPSSSSPDFDIMGWETPSGTTSSMTWITLNDDAGDAATTSLWSADKIYDQLALKVTDGCTDCLNATEIEDIYLSNTGDEINTADLVVNGVEVDFHNGASPGYPLLSGQSTCDSDACNAAAEYGRLCFDTDADTDGSVMVCTSAGWKEVDDDGAGGGEANTISSPEAGGLDLVHSTPKSGVDLRTVDADPDDFDLASDILSIDDTNWASQSELDAIDTCTELCGVASAAASTHGHTLAGSDFANQGTTTTVLHGNASGNPSWSAISLTADVTGILPTANGGTGIAYFTAAGPTVARTYTFPDGDTNVVTDGTACTNIEGTGLSISTGTLNADIYSGCSGCISPTEMGSGAYDLGTSLEADTLTEGGTGVPNIGDNLSVFAATTSAQLYGVLSDETGSGAGSPLAVFNQAPTIDSPTFTTAITATDLIDSAHYVADSIDNEHINWTDIDYLGDEGQPTAAGVGLASANLDDTDASVEWEDAADLESDGSLSANTVADNEIDYTNVTCADITMSDCDETIITSGHLRPLAQASEPASCTVGDLFVDTDADTEGSLKLCYATNTWKDVDDDGGSPGEDSIGVTQLDDGTDTASNDDVVMIDNGDNTQFIYIDVPDCDDGNGHLNYDTTGQAFSCGTTDDDDPEAADVSWSDLTSDEGSHTNTYHCKYNSTGPVLDCNQDPSVFVPANETDSAHDDCSEINNCVSNAWDADADIDADEIGEGKINFSTACASGNHYYLNGNDLACEADDDNPEAGDVSWADLTSDEGSHTDEYLCSYESTGTLIECDLDPATFAAVAGDSYTGDHNFGGADLELPQGQTPDTDGDIDLDFTDGSVVIQHGSAHAELSSATDVVVGKLIHSFAATLAFPDLLQAEIDQWLLKSIRASEFPHGIVVTEVYMATSASSSASINVENWDDPTTINGSNPTIDAIATSSSTETTEDDITYSTIGAGQLIMLDLDTSNHGWTYIEVQYYEPIA